MDYNKKNNTNRRKFIKGVFGATVCSCASLSLDILAFTEKNSIKGSSGNEHLAAACGTYCGACPAYLAKHCEDEQIKMKIQKRSLTGQLKSQKGIPDPGWMDGLLCDGCQSGGILAAHCQKCAIRICAAGRQSDSRCYNCDELPCYRITSLINMGTYLHRKEYLPNLKKIQEMGVEEWVKYEEERWRCPKCNLPMSWYDIECARCGEPRSKQLFPLT